MTLGRTSANKIKIKTDGTAGLRAVSCGCCSTTESCCYWSALGASANQYPLSSLPDSIRVDWVESGSLLPCNATLTRSGLNYTVSSVTPGKVSPITSITQNWVTNEWIWGGPGSWRVLRHDLTKQAVACLENLGLYSFEDGLYTNVRLSFNGGNPGVQPGWPTSVSFYAEWYDAESILPEDNNCGYGGPLNATLTSSDGLVWTGSGSAICSTSGDILFNFFVRVYCGSFFTTGNEWRVVVTTDSPIKPYYGEGLLSVESAGNWPRGYYQHAWGVIIS